MLASHACDSQAAPPYVEPKRPLEAAAQMWLASALARCMTPAMPAPCALQVAPPFVDAIIEPSMVPAQT